MAVFSNLEGTMKSTFILGKNGAKLSYGSGALSVQNYQGTALIPINAGEPVDDTHLVTLAYFNSHSGGGSGNALRGTVDPDPSLGTDGDVYYKVDAINILQIYVKDSGIWKPFVSQGDTSYVTIETAAPSDFILTNGIYVYSLPASVHGRGGNIIVQLQSPTGEVQDTNLTLDSAGNITISVGAQPTTNTNILIIGETNLTTPYTQLINKADWVVSGSEFTLSIPQTTHDQVPGAIFLSVYANMVDSATSTSPYNITAVETAIDGTGNVTLTANATFSGKVVISGK